MKAFLQKYAGPLWIVLIVASLMVIVLYAASKEQSWQEKAAKMPRSSCAEPTVVVLDDCDPDYKAPTFGDTLFLIGDDCKVVGEPLFGLNTCESLGSSRSVAVGRDGSFAVCEEAAHRMSWHGTDRKQIFESGGPMTAVDIAENGDLYALESSGTIDGAAVVIIDPASGQIKKRAMMYGGIDVVVDNAHDSVWIVGSHVIRLNTNLDLKFEDTSTVAWTAVSVDYAKDGSAWVAERNHPQRQGSKNRLLHFSPSGELLNTIDHFGFSPTCVAVDRNDDSVWTTGTRGTQVLKFDAAGNRLLEISAKAADAFVSGIRVDQRDGSVWAAGPCLTHYSKEGNVLGELDGFSKGQKYIGIVR